MLINQYYTNARYVKLKRPVKVDVDNSKRVINIGVNTNHKLKNLDVVVIVSGGVSELC